jgi:hypothetical protein
MYFKQTPVIRLKLLHLHVVFYLFKQVNVKLNKVLHL